MKTVKVEVLHGFKDKATGATYYPHQIVVFDEDKGSRFIRQKLVRLIARAVGKAPAKPTVEEVVKPEDDEGTGEEPECLEDMSKVELEELAAAYGVTDVVGTGSEGKIIKSDLIKAIEATR